MGNWDGFNVLEGSNVNNYFMFFDRFIWRIWWIGKLGSFWVDNNSVCFLFECLFNGCLFI